MGVYISEINMPKGEGSKLILQIFPNGEVYDEHGIRLGIVNWAEAIPVPPHGRLIDAEAYESLLRGLGDRNYRREKGTICDAIKFLHPYYAPTIIQASGKDTDVPTREEEV